MNKTNQKMLLAIGMVAALCICSVAVMADGTDATVDDVFYNDDSTLTYTILTEDTETSAGTVSVADGTTTSSGAVTIPLTVTNSSITYTVTEIAASGFAANTAITSVTIPSSVTSIGDSAFSGCTALTTATINNTDGAVTIGTSAFDITPTYAGLTAFTVTFDSGSGSSVDAQTVDYGSVATEPTAPTYEGYTLSGWYTDSECTTSFAFTTAITADLTLYAGWTATTYTVTFDSGDGSAVDSQTVAYGGTATEPTAPTYEGYTLSGWYTDSECTAAFDFETVVTADMTLYAGWTADDTSADDTTTDESSLDRFVDSALEHWIITIILLIIAALVIIYAILKFAA